MSELKSNMSKLKERLQKTFLELIKIDEIYNQENEIINYVKSWFESLGIIIIQDQFRNVIVRFPGKGEPLLLNTHLDTPENVPNLDFTIKGDIIRSKGRSILGADPKAGLAILLELAKYLKDNKIVTRPIEFVFTRGEEAGLHGAINLDYSLVSAKMGLVLDEDGPVNNIVIKAPAFYRLDCKIIGKTVHPRDWREGINALTVAAKAISKLKQGETAKGVTFNIGIFNAGTARNSVVGEAVFKAEFRSFNSKKLMKVSSRVEKLLISTAEKYGAGIEIDGALEFESFSVKTKSPLFKHLNSTFKKFKKQGNYYETFGGSDANILNSHGVNCVAIGSGYYLAHQYSEYVNLKEMEEILLFLVEFSKNPK